MPRCEYAITLVKPRQECWLGGVIVLFHHNQLNGPGVWWVHATRDGSPVLKTDVGWHNINGILIRTPRHQLFLHFRRLPGYMVTKRRP